VTGSGSGSRIEGVVILDTATTPTEPYNAAIELDQNVMLLELPEHGSQACIRECMIHVWLTWPLPGPACTHSQLKRDYCEGLRDSLDLVVRSLTLLSHVPHM
jgi:hypothetical protein